MSKQQIVAFTQKHKGSILAYSLIILAMMMVIVISISTSSIIEKKAASGTEFSMQSPQTADSGTNLALKAIRAGGNIDALALSLGGSCSNGKVSSATGPVGSTYELTFFSNTDGTGQIVDCSLSVNTIKNIKSVGTYKQTARAVSVAVAASGSVTDQTFSNSNAYAPNGSPICLDSTQAGFGDIAVNAFCIGKGFKFGTVLSSVDDFILCAFINPSTGAWAKVGLAQPWLHAVSILCVKY